MKPQSLLHIFVTIALVTLPDLVLARRGYVLPKPDKCSCEAPITKIIVQPVNMTIMVPDFVSFAKTFAELKDVELPVPEFYEEKEEIRAAEFIKETVVDTYTVQYDYQEVRNRVPVYNTTRIVVEDYDLIPTPQFNQTVDLQQRTYVDTKIDYVDEPYEDIVIERTYKNVTREFIVYKDQVKYVDQVHLVHLTEYVEEYEYVPTEVYVWRIELYDTILYQKQVKPGGGIRNAVEVDDITITKEVVTLPEVKFVPRPIVIHEPVTISREPIPVPQFANQTVKVAEKIMKKFPVPRFVDTVVQIPTYTQKKCSISSNQTQNGYLPSSCSCQVCQPCLTKCPPKDPSARPQITSALEDEEELSTISLNQLEVPNLESDGSASISSGHSADLQRVARGSVKKIESPKTWAEWNSVIGNVRRKMGF